MDNIFNKIPSISEDTLVYSIYPASSASGKSEVTALAASIEAFVEATLPNHIWHRDGFELKVVHDKLSSTSSLNNHDTSRMVLDGNHTDSGRWKLEGYMRVGDSVDDEWLAVWLLKEISARWDAAITVYDSDGEFLLIEAAEYLPSWVTPENSENRVWLYRGVLHLIRLAYLSAPSSRASQRRKLGGHESDDGDGLGDDDEGWLNVSDALQALRSSDPTEAPASVQDAVWKRISGYPSTARQHIHYTKAYLPSDIAKALHEEPTLVQKAVETFYTRDAVQLRVAHKMSRFPPQSSVLTSIRMTRTAYAQLVGQKFHPPKIFGTMTKRKDTTIWKRKDIGMKIACGFEMLYQESKTKSESLSADAQKASLEARKDALRRNTDYNEYIEKLKLSGYFKGELEGSSLWKEQEDKAALVFISSRREDDSSSRSSFATQVNAAVMRAQDVPIPSDGPEDSDSWLNIDENSLNQKLSETLRKPLSKENNRGESEKDGMEVDKPTEEDEEERLVQEQAHKLKGLASKIETFVSGEGTLEGAIFEDERMSDDDNEPLSEFSDDDSDDVDDDEEFRREEAEDAGAKQAREEAMNKLVPSLKPEEYGKMPATYYSNSQRMGPVTMGSEVRDDTSRVNKTGPESPKKSRPIRRPILPRDDFDGVDSDDETDDDDVDQESEEEQPQVVGEIEIDMGAEQEEFLEFSRTALGISDEMWNDIIRDRQDRGAYVPKTKKSKASEVSKVVSAPTPNTDEAPPVRLRTPQSGPRPNANPALDSFEAVMEAMEAELAKSRLSKQSQKKASSGATTKVVQAPQTKKEKSKGKGKERAVSFADGAGSDSEDEDDEAAMEAEIRAVLEREEGDSGDEEPMDYAMMRNFLESFKSQAGLAGPVGTLMSRLEPNWKLPRDES